LTSAVYASSEGLRTLLVEREGIGGQAGSSSRIRNYLGFSHGIGGAELARNAYQQAWVFGTKFMLMQEAIGLEVGAERHRLEVDGEEPVTAPTIVLATGVSYRSMGEVPGCTQLVGAGVFYGASISEAAALEDQPVFVVGGGNSAGQAAMHLCRYASQVTLLVRGTDLAASMSSYLQQALEATSNIDVRTCVEVADAVGDGRLERLTLRDP